MPVFPYILIDLTHALDESVPTWDGDCGFHHHTTMDYANCPSEYKFRVHKIGMNAGIGTHMDAPAHCIPGGMSIERLLLNDLITPCALIDVSKAAHERYSVSTGDIESFEREHGPIKPGSAVMIRTGWDRFWNAPGQYRNNHLFPSVSAEAAVYLLDRGIAGLGIDTLSPDRPEDGFPVHKLLLGAGKYIVENAANLDRLPPAGSFVFPVPLKIKDGTESPVRLIAFINRD